MFGQDHQQQSDDNTPAPVDTVVDGSVDNPAASTTVGAPSANTSDANNFGGNDFIVPDMPAPSASPDAPVANDSAASQPAYDAGFSSPAPANDSFTGSPAEPVGTPAASPASNDLLDIKQAALQQLSPLVDHLDQSPEEKFRTTMMMIQAADNQALISQAYQAAQEISDEKVRAQALLDVINEINYFTQQDGDNVAAPSL